MQPNESRRSSSAPSSAALPVESRREKRLNIAVPVKLFLDPNSANPQLCCTYEISMIGARLVTVSGITKVGQDIWLQRHTRRAKYRVIWIGEPHTVQAGQIGVETLEPANVIWENELRIRIMQK